MFFHPFLDAINSHILRPHLALFLRKYHWVCVNVLADSYLPPFHICHHKLTSRCCVSPMWKSMRQSHFSEIFILKQKFTVRFIEIGIFYIVIRFIKLFKFINGRDFFFMERNRKKRLKILYENIFSKLIKNHCLSESLSHIKSYLVHCYVVRYISNILTVFLLL